MIDSAAAGGDRLAKIIARSGLCSRRDAEGWIKEGRVAVNGSVIRTPAFNATDKDRIVVDGVPLAAKEGTRVWLYHKPAGLMVTEKDPEGRPTVFEKLQDQGLPRVVSIGRLDYNTEGLLLLTNDGGLKRVLELPSTGWLRKYRVRAHGTTTQAQLDTLKTGTTVDGISYGAIEATLESVRGANVWLEVSLREGKNREVKNVLFALGLDVNRLIRISYGPFQLGDLPVGAIEAVKARVLRDQLGKRLAAESGADFESPQIVARPLRDRDTGRGAHTVEIGRERFRFADRADGERSERAEPAPRRDRPGRPELQRPAPRPKREEAVSDSPPRKIHFDDGRESTDFEVKTYGKPPGRGKPDGAKPAGGKRDFGGKPKRDFGDKPRGTFGDKPKSSFAGKPRTGFSDKSKPTFSDRPKRDYGDRPRPAFADRPKREFSSPAPLSPRPDRDRPRSPRPDGDRPRAPRPSRGADAPARTERPVRDYTGKPRSFSDKPRSARPPHEGAAPAGAARKPYVKRDGASAGARKPYVKRDDSAAPRKPYVKHEGAAGARPARSSAGADRKPYVKREGAAGRPPRKEGPARGPRPTGGGPRKPSGDKPRTPRPKS